MASPPSPPPPQPSPFPHNQTNNPDYYYFVMAVAAIAVMLVISNIIAFACCSPSNFFCNLTGRFHHRQTMPTDRCTSELIPISKYRKEHSFDTECSVCLMGFREGEEVRQLPGCKHSYHAPCIDMWLYSHSSCPVCRCTVVGLPPPQRCPRAPQRPLFTESHAGMSHVVVMM